MCCEVAGLGFLSAGPSHRGQGVWAWSVDGHRRLRCSPLTSFLSDVFRQMAALKLICSGAFCLLLAACGGVVAPKIASPPASLPEKLPSDPREADKVAKDAFRNLKG